MSYYRETHWTNLALTPSYAGRKRIGFGGAGRTNRRVLEMGRMRKLEKLKPTSELTEGEWVRELEHIDNELTHVLDIFNFLEELFRLSNESEAALSAFNTTPLFWHIFRDCLQESLCMGLSRLCDRSPDVVNVRRVLAGAMDHSEFFSAEALRQRVAKRDLTESLADHLMESAWVPDSREDFLFLQKEVSRDLKRIEDIYLPIRNSYYGHRLTGIDARAMFESTNRTELGETLDVLRQLVGGLRFFYDNGIRPRVDVCGTKALDLTPRRFFRDVVRAVAGRDL
jgi:hypothetical protein